MSFDENWKQNIRHDEPKTVATMKASMRKVVALVSLLSLWAMAERSALGQATKVTLAISDFKNNTGAYHNLKLETSLPEMLKTELVQMGGITVLERSKIEAVLKEQALAQSGVLDSQDAQQVGRMLNAEFVLTGEITRPADRLRIDAHIVRVETGEVFGEKVTGPDEEAIEPMVRALARNIIYNLTGRVSRVQVVPVHKYYGQWIMAAGVGAGIAAAILHSSYKDSYDEYLLADNLAEFDDPYNKANRSYKARNISIAAAAIMISSGLGLWLESKSAHNQIYAQADFQNGKSLAIRPFYKETNKTFGLCLTVKL